MDDLKPFAEKLALGIGKWIKEENGGKREPEYKKNHSDLVTEVDRESEKRIINQIQSYYPDHGILSEETRHQKRVTELQEQYEYIWVIDPLDGTMNYVHHLSNYAVSIAIVHHGIPVIGVVYDPDRDELFTAVSGQGATLNGKQINVSQTKNIENGIINTGFSAENWDINNSMRYEFSKMFGRCRSIRITGSSALDLAYLACGRIDGFWQYDLKTWDYTAGMLILQEAGGKITDRDGHPFHIGMKNIFATNGRIHNKIVDILS